MTASRARNNDIGSERENSRIGVRRTVDVSAAIEPGPFGDFLPAIVNLPRSGNAGFDGLQVFAVQQRQFDLI